MPAGTTPLFGSYGYAVLDDEEFVPLFQRHRPEVFSGDLTASPDRYLSESEKAETAELGKLLGHPFRLNLGIYDSGRFIGWSTGVQTSAERFYMMNTGLFAEHRGKGIYSALLPRILEMLRGKGFQVVYSRHVATNNTVLVPKLKAGFVITHMELSDMFGLLVTLSYYFNPIRRRLLEFRAGGLMPDEELRAILGL